MKLCGGRNKTAEHTPANRDMPRGIKGLVIIFSPSNPTLWQLCVCGGGASWGAISHVALDPPMFYLTQFLVDEPLYQDIYEMRCVWINL